MPWAAARGGCRRAFALAWRAAESASSTSSQLNESTWFGVDPVFIQHCCCWSSLRGRGWRVAGACTPVAGWLLAGCSATRTARTTRRRHPRNIWVADRRAARRGCVRAASHSPRPPASPIVLRETSTVRSTATPHPHWVCSSAFPRARGGVLQPQTGSQALTNPFSPPPSVCQRTPQGVPKAQRSSYRPELGETAASRGALCFAIIL
jgi:hypothetical protein